MRDWIRNNKRFVTACATTGIMLFAFALASSLWGRDLFGWLYEKQQDPALPRHNYIGRSMMTLRAVSTGAIAIWALVTLIGYLFSVRAKPLWWLAALALFWWSLETWGSPRMARPLKLQFFYAVRDPDHRPKFKKDAVWNSDAIRCRWEASEFKEQDLNVVFLGDSFTFGQLLEPEKSFPNKVEALLQQRSTDRTVRVANFGWTSSSPVLSLRRLQDIGDKYKPDWVALCVDMSDVRDDIVWSAMIEKRGIYWFYDKTPLLLRIVQVSLPPLFQAFYRWTTHFNPEERYFISERPLEETRPYFDTIVESMNAIHAWCEERDVGYTVFILPRAYQYNADESPNNWEASRYTLLGPHSLEPFRYFAELRAQVDYSVHSLLGPFQKTDVFPTCFDHDPHWNDAGTTIAAEAIAPVLWREIHAPD